jgi:EmrB/QacA subfamily drug resistance transporter
MAASVLLGLMSVMLNVTSVSLAVPRIMSSLSTSLETAQWVVLAYMVTSTVLIPTTAWLGGRLGSRKLYIGGLSIFLVSQILCGIAWNVESLIVFRIIAGLGGGPLLPVALVILYQSFPPERQGTAVGLSVLAPSWGAALGFSFGGYLIDHWSWRYVFYFNTAFAFLGLMLALHSLKDVGLRHKRPLDLPGLITIILFLTTFLLGISQGQREGWFRSDYIVTLFTISIISFVAFIIVELKGKNPFLDLRLFKIGDFTKVILVSFINDIDSMGIFFLFSLYLQTFMDFTPLKAGLIIFPTATLHGATALFMGRLSDRVNLKKMILGGVSLRVIAIYRYTFLTSLTTVPIILSVTFLRSFCGGWIMPSVTKAALRSLPPEKVRDGAAFINLIRSIGQVTGMTMLVAVFSNRTDYHLSRISGTIQTASEGVQQTLSQLSNYLHLAGVPDGLARVKSLSVVFGMVMGEAILDAYHDTFMFMATILLFSIIPALLLKKVR